jgi:ATP-dependent helicase Lhr and Lhr-like helicase
METENSKEVSAFGLLHPKIQEELYAMRWEELRLIQVETIKEILAGDKHVLISARTAGGKTEAAFLPILSLFLTNKPQGIHSLYISPLKALINDQFRRLEDLCRRSEIPVYRWHGDVSQGSKNHLVKNPEGVLMITPESVESLFINRSFELDRLFRNLEFIVVDEIHSFIGAERGAHLKSLISRINGICKKRPRLVGLSATVGDTKLACEWLLPKEPDAINVIEDDGAGKEIRYRVHGYLRSLTNGDEIDPTDSILADDFVRFFSREKALIFGNAKAKLEYFADLALQRIKEKKLLSCFRVHHGSLSKMEREDTEEELRERKQAAVFCSSSLEMGIDVGDISIIGQLEAPWSVNSLVQRLGRSGRKDHQPSVLRMFIDEDEVGQDGQVVSKLHCDLIQAIAMSELMFEKWCEPPDKTRLHFSTLVHQILSVVKQRGGIRTHNLFDILIERGAFIDVKEDEFLSILKNLGAKYLLEQIDDGSLILGIQGERIVNNYKFYSAFLTKEEIKVIYNAKAIGTVAFNPSMVPGSFLILAGRRWKILDVDEQRNELLVEPSKGGKLPKFPSTVGPDLHKRVRHKMVEVLTNSVVPIYLDSTAQQILKLARSTSKEINLSQIRFFKEGENTIWFTWASSRINRTLMGLGKYRGNLKVEDAGIALVFNKTSIDKIKEVYNGFLAECPTAEELASSFPMLIQEKYDAYLPENLLERAFARNYLDLHSALELIGEQIKH